MRKAYLLDVAERVFWTAAEAAVAVAAVYAIEAPKEWIPVLAAFLAYLKGLVARYAGEPTAQLQPWAIKGIKAAVKAGFQYLFKR